MLWPKV